MSQVDFLTFFPLFFWFFILFVFFYFCMFTFVVPLLFTVLKVREFFFNSLLFDFFFFKFCLMFLKMYNYFMYIYYGIITNTLIFARHFFSVYFSLMYAKKLLNIF